MTITKFSETVLEVLGRSNGDFNIDIREPIAIAEIVVAALLKQYLDRREPIPDGFYTTHEMIAQYDNKRKRWFIQFVPSVVTISGGAGIKSIGPVQDETINYMAISSGMLATIKGLEIQNLGGKIGYWLEGQKAWFENQLADKEMLVRMIPQFTSLDEDEEMFSADEIAIQVFDAVVARLRYEADKGHEDKANDNVNN